MTVNTGNIAKLLWPGLNAIWGTDYTEHPAEWSDLSTRTPPRRTTRKIS
jgi:hypothetical protein